MLHRVAAHYVGINTGAAQKYRIIQDRVFESDFDKFSNFIILKRINMKKQRQEEILNILTNLY